MLRGLTAVLQLLGGQALQGGQCTPIDEPRRKARRCAAQTDDVVEEDGLLQCVWDPQPRVICAERDWEVSRQSWQKRMVEP